MTDSELRHDDQVDEMLEETFPASDAPGNTVVTGIGVDTSRLVETSKLTHASRSAGGNLVTDNRDATRFELTRNDQIAFLTYERRPDGLVLAHTEVPPSLQGQHIGDLLVDAALKSARAEGLRIIAVCPFVRAYLRRHPASGAGH